MDRPPRLAAILAPERNSFGIVRLAMALAVLASHSFFFVTGQPSSEPLQRWTGHSLGEHAVQVFFFLSGILVTESLMRSRGVIDFATSRVLRIFPGLLCCVVLTALVLGPALSQRSLAAYFTDPDLPRYLLKTLLLVTGAAPLPGVFEGLPAAGLFNMSLWTLKYEVICYAGLALLGLTGLLHAKRHRYAVAAVLALALVAVLPRPSETGAHSLVEHIRYFTLYFGAGVLASLLKEHLVISATWTAALFALFVATLGTAWVELGGVLFIGSATLLVSTWCSGPLRRWTNAHDLSFGIYIYAAPLQQALLQLMPGLDPISLSVVALVPVLVLAAASWALVEKPAMSLRHHASRTIDSWAVTWLQRLPQWQPLHSEMVPGVDASRPGLTPRSSRIVRRPKVRGGSMVRGE